jgi:SAM-dependent MidA family methyltransferase
MTYDPEARRDTPLALKLKDRIRREGPISVRMYVDACLRDPEHGYYVTQNAIGAAGDFITAPEISQIFGELLGLWCVVVWERMSRPPLNLIELGPGRGTLMSDALRATRAIVEFHRLTKVHLVEVSETLRRLQRETLKGFGPKISWHEDINSNAISRDASIIIANEYLDTRAPWQYVKDPAGWRHRTVELDAGGRLVFGVGDTVGARTEMRLAPFRDAPAGTIIESAEGHTDPNINALRRDHRVPLAALFIDYGHVRSAAGETLQAVRRHASEHSLTSPGEADLTIHVDFEAFAAEARDMGLAVEGPITQGEFLGQLGIMERASRLMSANPEKAAEIEAGVARLMAPNGMGTRFKVIAVHTMHRPLPGFRSVDPERTEFVA